VESIEFFLNLKNDFIAKSLLDATKTKSFILIMHIMHHAVSQLKSLSLVFQSGELNFSHIQPSLEECEWTFERYSDGIEIWSEIKSAWHRYENQIGSLVEKDELFVKSVCNKYFSLLIDSIYERFPDCELLSAFKIFDAVSYPDDLEIRRSFGHKDLKVLFSKYQCFLTSWETLVCEFFFF